MSETEPAKVMAAAANAANVAIAAMMRQKIGHAGIPGPAISMKAATLPSSMASSTDVVNDDISGSGSKLTHMTKARVRGPKRRLPQSAQSLAEDKSTVKPPKCLPFKSSSLSEDLLAFTSASEKVEEPVQNTVTSAQKSISYPTKSSKPNSLIAERMAAFSDNTASSSPTLSRSTVIATIKSSPNGPRTLMKEFAPVSYTEKSKPPTPMKPQFAIINLTESIGPRSWVSTSHQTRKFSASGSENIVNSTTETVYIKGDVNESTLLGGHLDDEGFPTITDITDAAHPKTLGIEDQPDLCNGEVQVAGEPKVQSSTTVKPRLTAVFVEPKQTEQPPKFRSFTTSKLCSDSLSVEQKKAEPSSKMFTGPKARFDSVSVDSTKTIDSPKVQVPAASKSGSDSALSEPKKSERSAFPFSQMAVVAKSKPVYRKSLHPAFLATESPFVSERRTTKFEKKPEKQVVSSTEEERLVLTAQPVSSVKGVFENSAIHKRSAPASAPSVPKPTLPKKPDIANVVRFKSFGEASSDLTTHSAILPAKPSIGHSALLELSESAEPKAPDTPPKPAKLEKHKFVSCYESYAGTYPLTEVKRESPVLPTKPWKLPVTAVKVSPNNKSRSVFPDVDDEELKGTLDVKSRMKFFAEPPSSHRTYRTTRSLSHGDPELVKETEVKAMPLDLPPKPKKSTVERPDVMELLLPPKHVRSKKIIVSAAASDKEDLDSLIPNNSVRNVIAGWGRPTSTTTTKAGSRVSVTPETISFAY
ncbi:uncharacterized protein V1518DRAFT_410597 [Limtongia smithiae]|uniref:uncharacterized protein n=1 Tax=Limtongia smithiae TaxID=1125753 RepID=UPI0034CE9B2A